MSVQTSTAATTPATPWCVEEPAEPQREAMRQPSTPTGRKRSIHGRSASVASILSRLSADELETAARSSYEYPSSRSKCDVDPEEYRYRFAGRFVERILESKHGDEGPAFAKVREILAFRETAGIDRLVRAFDGGGAGEDTALAAALRRSLSSGKFCVRGFDREGRSTLCFVPRNVRRGQHDLGSALYSIERAIASTRSGDGTINCAVDFGGFSLSKNTPPPEAARAFLAALRTVYAGRIHRIFLANAPASFSVLWRVFSPLVGTDTRGKIVLVAPATSPSESTRGEQEVLGLYDHDQVPSWLVPGGTKNRPLDLDEYLCRLPFDAAFDDL